MAGCLSSMCPWARASSTGTQLGSSFTALVSCPMAASMSCLLRLPMRA